MRQGALQLRVLELRDDRHRLAPYRRLRYGVNAMGEDQRRATEPNAEDRRAGDAFARLVAIMRVLRAPGGCPWDAEQDLGTLRAYLIEEAYEVLEAIESVLENRP